MCVYVYVQVYKYIHSMYVWVYYMKYLCTVHVCVQSDISLAPSIFP